MSSHHQIGDDGTISLRQRANGHPLTPDLYEVLSSPVIRMLVQRATVLRSRETRAVWMDRAQQPGTASVDLGPDTRTPSRSVLASSSTPSRYTPREVPCRS
jgi:hypothetical protein